MVRMIRQHRITTLKRHCVWSTAGKGQRQYVITSSTLLPAAQPNYSGLLLLLFTRSVVNTHKHSRYTHFPCHVSQRQASQASWQLLGPCRRYGTLSAHDPSNLNLGCAEVVASTRWTSSGIRGRGKQITSLTRLWRNRGSAKHFRNPWQFPLLVA